MRFAEKVVIVTGSGRGIGARTVRRFASEGASVVVTDIDETAARAVAETIPGAIAIEADVSSLSSMRHLVDTAEAEFGRVDVFVNNAMSCTDASFLELSEEQVTRDIMVTLGGPFFASQAVLPGMARRQSGVVLSVASVNGLAYFGNEAYSAAKAGVINLTKALASQFGKYGVRVNAVAPSTIRTEYWDQRSRTDPEIFDKLVGHFPLGRLGATEDVADALLFLASEEAAWVTGITLPVDGGLMSGNLGLVHGVFPALES